MTAEAAEAARHARTLEYTGGRRPTAAVGITCSVHTAASPTGQKLVLSAVNLMARVHPKVHLAVPDLELVVSSPAGGDSLMEACRALAMAAHAGVVVEHHDELPPGILSIGIGDDPGEATVYAGGRRWTALTDVRPVPVTDEPSSFLGAALALTFAAGIIFRMDIGLEVQSVRSLSLWDLVESDGPTGPPDCGPLDVGSAWLVGAGAVGSSLAWWAAQVGVAGAWTVIDGDDLDSTNLERSLGLFEYQSEMAGGGFAKKANGVAALLDGAEAYPGWWSDWVEEDRSSPDVLIPVANDFGVRAAVASYGHPLTVHATTSRDWTAELHRHLPGRDGCISCRLPEGAPRFACAVVPTDEVADKTSAVDGAAGSRDAALPFLSGAAGLLLLAGLLQLQHGQWGQHPVNHWRVFFDDTRIVRPGQWSCSIHCATSMSAEVRTRIHGHTRWAQ
jgi:hypothetical protein